MNKKRVLGVVFITVWAIIAVLGLTWGIRFDWPDNVHVDYGVPFVWGTLTLSTIIGAVNIWSVDILALTTNLVFWIGIMLVASVALVFFVKEKE